MIALVFALQFARAAVDRPIAITRSVIHLAKQNANYGEGARLTVETKRYDDATIHVLTNEATARPTARHVLAASTGRLIEAEMLAWVKKIGSAPRGLDDVDCPRPVRTELGKVRATMCLDALAAADRAKFYAWFARAESLAR